MQQSPSAPPPEEGGFRVPPHNDEAERSLLGAIFIDNRVMDEILGRVGAEDFYRQNHRYLFRAMEACHRRSEAIHPITVGDQLDAEDLLEAVGGPNFVSRLSGEVPSAANVEHYANIVRRKSAL